MATLQRTNSCTDIGFTLRRQFGKPDFRYARRAVAVIRRLTRISRPHQREIIEAALAGYDIYVQAATSFGKSLCFQLPAVIDTGSTWAGNKAVKQTLISHSHSSSIAAFVIDGKYWFGREDLWI